MGDIDCGSLVHGLDAPWPPAELAFLSDGSDAEMPHGHATRQPRTKRKARPKGKRRTYKDAEETLAEALLCTKAELQTLKAENRRLSDVNAALVLLDDQAAHFASTLARAAFPTHRPEHPLDCPVSSAVTTVLQSAWTGRLPPEGLYAAWTKISIQNILELDVSFRNKMRQWVGLVARDPASRPLAQTIIVNALNTRNGLSHYLATHAPEALMQFWAAALPRDAAEIAVLRQQMGDTVLAMRISREQVDRIAAAYEEYSSGLDAARAAVTRMQRALATARRACATPSGCMQVRLAAADKVEKLVTDLRAAQLRPVWLYERLIAEATSALGWRCATALMLRAHPYVANIADACEILARAHYPVPLKGKR